MFFLLSGSGEESDTAETQVHCSNSNPFSVTAEETVDGTAPGAATTVFPRSCHVLTSNVH